jgi:cysteine-rich repeat protein
MSLSSVIDGITIGSGSIQLSLAGQVRPESSSPTLPDDAPGAVRRDGSVPSFGSDFALGVGIKDDLVNQLLWAAWYGGGLDLPNLRAQALAAGLDVERLAAFAYLPPVLMPAAQERVEFAIGELLLEMTIDLGGLPGAPLSGRLDLAFMVAASVLGKLDVDAQAQQFRFTSESATAQVEILNVDDPVLLALLKPLLRRVTENVARDLVRRVVDTISLPRLPLSQVGGAAGRVLALGGLPTVGRPTTAYTRVTGSLVDIADCGDGIVLAEEACDDGNRVDGDCCTAGCDVEPASTPCDADSDQCTADVCDGTGACSQGPALDCDDAVACTVDSCDPVEGCVNAPIPGCCAAASDCDDGDACTGEESCQDGTCAAGTAPDCDDGNPCTDDTCDPVGACAQTANTAPCEDGDPCTTLDRCQDGVCIGSVVDVTGIACRLEALREAPCGDEVLPKKLAKIIRKQTKRVEGVLKKAAQAATQGKDRKVSKLRTKATKLLDGIRSHAAKAASARNQRRAISEGCRAAVDDLVTDRQQLIAGAVFE